MKQSGAMFLVNREGMVLLVHPSGAFNKKAPWMPPKEELEPGETALDAAKRAVVEELSLAPDSYDTVRELGPVTYKSKSKQVHCFIARYLGEEDDVTLDWENDMYAWFAPDEARRMVKEEYGPALERGLASGDR